MNKKIYLLIIVLTTGLILYSCNKEDEDKPAPVITILELGEGDNHGNDNTAKVGGELHMEIDIVAEGRIDKVTVLIHPEGGHDKGILDGEWELDTIYTKFSGLKNALFHEHVEIDSIAEPGDYHFDFIVTDQQGYQSSAESDIIIIEN